MFKKIFRFFFVAGYVLTIVCFLIACLSPFLNPAQWWFFGFLGLIFPYILALLLLYTLALGFAKSKWTFLALICLLLGWKSINAVFAFHIWSSFNLQKETNHLRVMTWNMRGLYPWGKKVTDKSLAEHQQKMLDIIDEYQPDVIAMQEFSGFVKQSKNNNRLKFLSRGYKYYFFPNEDSLKPARREQGTAIFSKLPIIDSSYVTLSNEFGDGNENLIWADILFNADTIRVFSGHLKSYGFMRSDYSDLSKIKNDADERLDASKNIFRKMRSAFQKRGQQCELIKEKLEAAEYPEIFCGDLNDVPNSYAYFSVKGEKKDAFLKKGFGFGKTYYSFASTSMRKIPTLRIDYIFTDPRFEINQATRVKKILSDHIPVITDLSLPSK